MGGWLVFIVLRSLFCLHFDGKLEVQKKNEKDRDSPDPPHPWVVAGDERLASCFKYLHCCFRFVFSRGLRRVRKEERG